MERDPRDIISYEENIIKIYPLLQFWLFLAYSCHIKTLYVCLPLENIQKNFDEPAQTNKLLHKFMELEMK